MSRSPDTTPVRRRRRRGCGCVALLLLLIVSAELVLRSSTRVLGTAGEFRGILEEDGSGGLRTVAGFRGHVTFEGRRIETRINNVGMRGADVDDKSGPRVLMLGDSMVFGFGVEEGETLPAALARRLSASVGEIVEVGNGGIPGFGTNDQADVLGRFLDTFDPDVVVSCVFVGNDFVDDTRLRKIVYNGYVLEGPVARMTESSWRVRMALRFRVFYTAERLAERLIPSLSVDRLGQAYATPEDIEAAAGLPPLPMQEYGLFMDAAADSDLTRKVQDNLRRSLGRLRDQAGDRPLLVLITPTWVHVLDDLWAFEVAEQGWPPRSLKRGRGTERVRDVCEELGIPSVDLLPRMRAEPDAASLFHAEDFHFSPEGCERVAAWIEPQVGAMLSGDRSDDPSGEER